MHRAVLLTLLFLALGLSSLATRTHAEDATPGETRYVTQMAELPEPSVEHAIDIEAPLFSWEGKSLGTFTLKAQPARTAEGTLIWTVSEKIVLSGTAHHWSEAATLDRYLRPLRGKAGGNRPKMRPYEVTWQETENGYSFSRRFVAGDRTITESATIDRPRPVTATLASICLFCRMTLPVSGMFEVGMLSPDADQEKNIVQRATWAQGQRTKWKGVESFVVKGSRNDKNLIELHFHPETKALMGLRFGLGAQGLRGEVRVPQAEPALPPAQTANEAATRGALAFATGDVDLIEKTVHWPTLHAEAQAAHVASGSDQPFPDLDAYKRASLDDLRRTLTSRPRALIEAGLKGAESQVTQEKLADGVLRFTYPPLFQNMTLDVAAFDGVWYLVRWPGTSGG